MEGLPQGQPFFVPMLTRSTVFRTLLSAAALPLLVGVSAAVGAAPGPGECAVTFLALPRGEATLVQSADGVAILLGAGAPGEGKLIAAELRRRGVKRLRSIYVTSWIETSYGGASELLKLVPTRYLQINPIYVASPGADRLYRDAVRRHNDRTFELKSLTPGQETSLSFSPPLRVRVLSPTGPMLDRFAKDPNCSMVLEVENGKTSFVSLGATTRRHQQAFWSTGNLQPYGQLLQVGRNGKPESLLPSLLKPLRTRDVVFNIPRSSRTAPDPGLLATLKKAGVRVHRTDRSGSLTFILNGQTVRLRR